MVLVDCEICGRRTPGGRLCSVRCIEEHARLATAASGAQFRCRVCGFPLNSRRRRIDPALAGVGLCSARCRDSELIHGRPRDATMPPPQTAEAWVRELDRRLIEEPGEGFGPTLLGLVRDIMASLAPLPKQAQPEGVPAMVASEAPRIMNPEGATSDDPATRRFALLEIDEG